MTVKERTRHDRRVVVVALIAFFALCAGFVAVCQRIIGPDPEGVRLSTGPGDVEDVATTPEEVAAP
jgi:uncharacterized membrane protein AbrB (regulator of aidB expression)